MPRTLAQQQVPKMELAVAVLWRRQTQGGTVRRRNSVTSVVTLAECICQGCWPCDRGLPLCHHRTTPPSHSSASGALCGAAPSEGDTLPSQEADWGVSI